MTGALHWRAPRPNVASERGICLSPGFLNDHTGEFVWIPFDCEEKMPCALYTHKSDSRKFVLDFVRLVQKTYEGSYLKV